MGLLKAKLSLSNPRKPQLQPLAGDALADTGTVYLCIPAHIRGQLEQDQMANDVDRRHSLGESGLRCGLVKQGEMDRK